MVQTIDFGRLFGRRTNENDNLMRTKHPDFHPRGLLPFMETLLQETYWCETQLCDILESVRSKATADPLREALIAHLEETRNQVGRLEKVFSLLGRQKEALFCVGMQGLVDEGWQAVDETPEGSAERDAALIIAMQRIEHYEIVSYASLHALAVASGYQDVSDLFEMSLAEEKEADGTLTRLAISLINPEATRDSIKQPDKGQRRPLPGDTAIDVAESLSLSQNGMPEPQRNPIP